MDAPEQREITPAMLEAGVAALAKWKCEDDYVSDREAVTEIFKSMKQADRATPHAQTSQP